MDPFAVDRNDGSLVGIEVVEALAQASELLVQQPLLVVNDACKLHVRFRHLHLLKKGVQAVRRDWSVRITHTAWTEREGSPTRHLRLSSRRTLASTNLLPTPRGTLLSAGNAGLSCFAATTDCLMSMVSWTLTMSCMLCLLNPSTAECLREGLQRSATSDHSTLINVGGTQFCKTPIQPRF